MHQVIIHHPHAHFVISFLAFLTSIPDFLTAHAGVFTVFSSSFYIVKALKPTIFFHRFILKKPAYDSKAGFFYMVKQVIKPSIPTNCA